MSAIRKPPLPEIVRRYHPLGECRWCGGMIFKNGNPCELNPRRNWHDGRLGEPDCFHAYRLLTDPATQRHAVYWRDKGRCYICGVVHQARAYQIWIDSYGDRSPSGYPQSHVGWLAPSGWELEHKIPLWKVEHLPDDERRWYFGLDNLAVACRAPCHQRKSAEEAAERAKTERLGQRRVGRPKTKTDKRAAARARWESMP